MYNPALGSQFSLGVSCRVSVVVTSLRCIEFQDSSTSNTHPVPRAMSSAIALVIVIAKIPDGLCHILPTDVGTHSSRCVFKAMGYIKHVSVRPTNPATSLLSYSTMNIHISHAGPAAQPKIYSTTFVRVRKISRVV